MPWLHLLHMLIVPTLPMPTYPPTQVMHPTEFTFASASADNIKKFQLPTGVFLHNTLQMQRTMINGLALNRDNVMASGGDNGTLWFWDWKSGNCFQARKKKTTHPEPGKKRPRAEAQVCRDEWYCPRVFSLLAWLCR